MGSSENAQPEKVWPGRKHLKSLSDRVSMLQWWHELFNTLFPIRKDGELEDAEMWERRISIYKEVSPHFFLRLRKMIADELALEMCRLLDPIESGGGQNKNEVLALLVDEARLREVERQMRAVEEKSEAAKESLEVLRRNQRRVQEERGHVPETLQKCVLEAARDVEKLEAERVEAERDVDELEEEAQIARYLDRARRASAKLRKWRNKRKAHSALGGSSDKDKWLYSPQDLTETKHAIFAFMEELRMVRDKHDPCYSYEETIVSYDGMGLIHMLNKANDYDRLVEEGQISKARRHWAIVEDPERRARMKEVAELSGVWDSDE